MNFLEPGEEDAVRYFHELHNRDHPAKEDQVSLLFVRGTVCTYVVDSFEGGFAELTDSCPREHILVTMEKRLEKNRGKIPNLMVDYIYDTDEFSESQISDDILTEENIGATLVEYLEEECPDDINLTNFYGSDYQYPFINYFIDKYKS